MMHKENRMMRPIAALLVLSILTALAGAAETGALGIPPNAPKVGVRPGTMEDYKPVVGTYGGRIVRDTLGEPKSFNPVTVGETSTSEYTARMFQGMTELNPYTGETRPS